ncbi:hypothetical protein C2845_PM15G07520 [Panicum miliaceum]|uniref:Uncharacterized protein n=1 Tax=Panicum miliaceum TaxID=4540 RepID=A0A3L6Q661_PANMI|nr:hypothetical protein C2845_PM15G07520 [Panicum miliaceum]
MSQKQVRSQQSPRTSIVLCEAKGKISLSGTIKINLNQNREKKDIMTCTHQQLFFLALHMQGASCLSWPCFVPHIQESRSYLTDPPFLDHITPINCSLSQLQPNIRLTSGTIHPAFTVILA